jgi:hypothetical protein
MLFRVGDKGFDRHCDVVLSHGQLVSILDPSMATCP